MSQKVLLFGDVGIDDTIALIYAYLNDDVEVIGIVADYGNVSRENAIANILYIRSLFPTKEVEDIKVIAGAHIPMTGEPPVYVPEIHGEYGLGPIIPPKNMQNGISENFCEIIDLIETYKDELVIVNIGRLTSLASLFILYKSLMTTIKEYYIMGGAFWVPGNITAVSEANFHGDPVAAQVVLAHANNVTIIPLNVTKYAIATPQMVEYIDRMGSVSIVKVLLDYYYDFYKKRNPSIQGSPLHDVLTLMAVVKPDMMTYQYLPVHIIQAQTGIVRGQSIADIRPYVNLEDMQDGEEVGGRVHRIAFNLDYQKFYIDFMSIMTGERFS
ncbi:MAG: nucleoside hydrolase [Bacillota bacterium]|uniref:Nucleoside hydrolase n=2 Tax=Virgibacillus salarius TaxID=447199 RepID=A0A941DUY3_9BACI|nr:MULTISPECIES: nucleoside hydrolase [Bacillaceae]NAZ08679.1 nucleoside hydrolase [Agaribacter marinus]MBR7795967.1 nucleoside hydrolase [Virgibacillus salarius]MCC2248746.1 nucleoside hydrolase [Virgibacillus sp. AGTR]MDY7043960.1 nucleoside hydrolase [Virgibacillus sp. M23]QRZ17963.1 nucleoside hydrolase [Virgibacillus sp. AGTR]